jgi:ribosomal RNA assembly protein
MAIDTVMIPEARKAALIGTEGATKALIEKETGTKISVRECVTIEGDAIGVLTCRNIVLAIARGFHPKDAIALLDEDYGIEVISLRNETEKAEKRLFARIIGRHGLARKTIEDETGAKLCIYGKTVSIIGDSESLPKAREAVELLLKGKTHAYVFKRLKGK